MAPRSDSEESGSEEEEEVRGVLPHSHRKCSGKNRKELTLLMAVWQLRKYGIKWRITWNKMRRNTRVTGNKAVALNGTKQ